ncbi:hypothetical protein ACFXPV_23680 [Streptomyces sp. NPDC059118]|uniref:hypothetical protein n=1 Tax=unclassified Streptomyces TaxID=2593676 RepID=UPI00369EF4CB
MASSVLVEDDDQAGPEVRGPPTIVTATVRMVRSALKIDGVTAVLLAATVVPWWDHLFESTGLPSGARFQYRQLADRTEAAEEGSAQAGRAADDPSRTARIARVPRGGRGRRGIGHLCGQVRGICRNR